MPMEQKQSFSCYLSLPKHRHPKRPLVEVKREVKVKRSTHLSVVSYNLLAQDLIEKNLHLYQQCSSEHLKWEFRKHNLINDLTESSADVCIYVCVCM